MSITRDGYETTSIGAGDLPIGAVEIKDALIDTRAKVKTDGVDNALVVMQNSQPLPAGAAEEVGGNLAAAATVAGAIDGAAVVTDANATIQQYLRGLVAKLIPVQGVTTGLAVITDADGTLQQYLRGLVKLTAEVLGPVLGAVDGAAIVTDADGTIQRYLRGLVKLFAARIPVLGGAAAVNSVPIALSTEDGAKVPSLGGAAAAAAVPVTLATEDTAKVPSLGAAAAAGSTPVTFSTEDAAKVPSLGSALAAASIPVVQASDSPDLPVGVKSDETPIDPTAVAATQINGNISTVLNGDVNLTAKERYIIEFVPDAPDRIVRGYLKFGGAATIRGGPLLTSIAPSIACLATAKKVYFIRDPLTAFDGYILVHLIS